MTRPSPLSPAPDAGTAATIVAILAHQALIDPESITHDMALSDLGLDSLAMVEAIFAMEEAFDISVPFSAGQGDGGTIDTSTVASLIEGVQTLITQQAA